MDNKKLSNKKFSEKKSSNTDKEFDYRIIYNKDKTIKRIIIALPDDINFSGKIKDHGIYRTSLCPY